PSASVVTSRFSRTSGDSTRTCALRSGCPVSAAYTRPRMTAVPVFAWLLSRGGASPGPPSGTGAPKIWKSCAPAITGHAIRRTTSSGSMRTSLRALDGTAGRPDGGIEGPWPCVGHDISADAYAALFPHELLDV